MKCNFLHMNSLCSDKFPCETCALSGCEKHGTYCRLCQFTVPAWRNEVKCARVYLWLKLCTCCNWPSYCLFLWNIIKLWSASVGTPSWMSLLSTTSKYVTAVTKQPKYFLRFSISPFLSVLSLFSSEFYLHLSTLLHFSFLSVLYLSLAFFFPFSLKLFLLVSPNILFSFSSIFTMLFLFYPLYV